MIAPSRALDVTSVDCLRKRVDAAFAQGASRIIFDMRQVEFVDSAGFALILATARKAKGAHGLLSLVNVGSRVYTTLKIMRVVDFVPVSRLGTYKEVREPGTSPLWRTTFPVAEAGLCDARERIQELIGRLSFSDDAAFDLMLAAGEALGNAIDHTSAHGVLCTVSGYGDRVVIDVADCGDGLPCSEQDLGKENSPCAERGRGIMLMRMLCDSVSITKKCSGQGTVVRLVKLLS